MFNKIENLQNVKVNLTFNLKDKRGSDSFDDFLKSNKIENLSLIVLKDQSIISFDKPLSIKNITIKKLETNYPIKIQQYIEKLGKSEFLDFIADGSKRKLFLSKGNLLATSREGLLSYVKVLNLPPNVKSLQLQDIILQGIKTANDAQPEIKAFFSRLYYFDKIPSEVKKMINKLTISYMEDIDILHKENNISQLSQFENLKSLYIENFVCKDEPLSLSFNLKNLIKLTIKGIFPGIKSIHKLSIKSPVLKECILIDLGLQDSDIERNKEAKVIIKN